MKSTCLWQGKQNEVKCFHSQKKTNVLYSKLFNEKGEDAIAYTRKQFRDAIGIHISNS